MYKCVRASVGVCVPKYSLLGLCNVIHVYVFRADIGIGYPIDVPFPEEGYFSQHSFLASRSLERAEALWVFSFLLCHVYCSYSAPA